MKLGKLESVDPRTVWAVESTDFTPWLSTDENIVLLGEAIGMELEVQHQEKSVGPFRADILCKHTLDDSYVLIENQLEKTDHTHLGQLLTYAAGLNAVTIIWISRNFTDEHRATLDWLNRITEEKINFFGIEIELFKIGDSMPAPRFNLVSKPNNWSKSVQRAVDLAELSDTKSLQLDFWQAFKDYLEKNNSKLRATKPQPQHWYNFSMGKSNCYMNALVNTRDNRISVTVSFTGPESKARYHKLHDKYEAESKEKIDASVEWEELPEANESRVRIDNKADIKLKAHWEEQHKWLMENLEKFDAFFRPKIKLL